MKKLVIIFILLFCTATSAQQKGFRIYNSFNAGELSPLLSTREDLAKFQSGCEVMENLFPLPQGAAQKRPGTKYVATAKDAAKVRLLPFQFSTTQSYVLELGNQYMRFYTSNAVVFDTFGTEDLSGIGSIVAHWLCDDNLGTQAVLDDDGNTHDGAMAGATNTEDVSVADAESVANEAFNLTGTDYFTVTDHTDFTFGDGSDDSPFSIVMWVNYVANGAQFFISKTSSGQQEWQLGTDGSDLLAFRVIDQDASGQSEAITANEALTAGWHFICAIYDGRGGTEARNGMKLYIDWVEVKVATSGTGSYDSMNNYTSDVAIGSNATGASLFDGKVDNIAIFSKALTAVEIASLTGNDSTTSTEIETPYLTADLFELKFEQSADVLYITHPDYETRKLIRLGNSIWQLKTTDITNGPFRTQNSDVTKTIAASGSDLSVGESVTLTAVGHAPFVSGTTAGHLPSGSTATDKSNTGALFKLIHPIADLDFVGSLINAADNVDCGTIFKGGGWRMTTLGTWRGVVEVQRNYTIGTATAGAGWDTVFKFTSGTSNTTGIEQNIATATRTEDDGDASYQVVFVTDWGGTLEIHFTTDQTEVVGIVEITAVTSTTVATGTVIQTIGGVTTDATYKWAESSWSNLRGWPGTIAFFEDRLIFGGNPAQPDTIWGSVTGDYENMLAGANDADAIIFTLTSRQVNAIQWLVGKDKILIGTSGAEWTLNGGSDEPLTPTNVKAEQHSTYGSADIQAILANDSTLFFQRGAQKMRELAFNWELDAYVAPDMTILAKEVTGSGITEMEYQQIPDAILWCIKQNGDIATFSFERAENVTAWSRQLTDGDFESVTVINGTTEEEVWVSVQRDINGDTTARYIEYFAARDFGTDPCDAYFVDSGITYDSTATTTITGLGHLEAESVSVYADGLIQTSQTVSSGSITITSASTVQAGLPYTVQLKTMPLSFLTQGGTIHGRKKKIGEVIASWYKSGDFSVGKDASKLQTHTISGLTTDEDRKTFPPGLDRFGQIFVYQQSPEPLTLLALMPSFEIQ